MADFIPSFRSTAGELAGSAHKILLNSYKNQSIIEKLSWQGQGRESLLFSENMMHEIVLVGFYLLTLIYSVIIHEVSHGVMALFLGDLTAKYAGRLNLNPMKHIDPFGSVILPVLLFITQSPFIFGWAKPVPYNPYNLRDQKWGPTLVALAGPASNFIVAFVAALIASMLPIVTAAKVDIIRRLYMASPKDGFMDKWGLLADSVAGSFWHIIFLILLMIILWNVVLGCFNLLPVPPLDGSKILYTFLSLSERTVLMIEQYGLFLLIFVIFFFSEPIGIFINFVLSLFLRLTL